MAKDSYDYEGSGFDDGLDFNDNGVSKPRGRFGQARKAVSEFSTNAYDAAFNDFKNVDKWERAFVNELPPQHKFVYDTYQQARQTGEELYDQFTKETRPILGEISKKLDSMVPQDSLLKGLTQKMKDKFWDAPQGGPNQESLDNQALQQMMTETFGGLDVLAAQRASEAEKKQTARSITEQKIGQEQHESLIAVVSPMQQSLKRLETYQLNVGAKIEKKILELSFRKYMIAGRTYEHSRKAHLETMDQMKALVANTALPDYAKIEKGERFKEMMRDRAMGGIQNALFGADSAVGQLMEGFKKDIKAGISTFTSALQAGSMGLDMADSYFGKDSGMTIFESLGMLAGGEIGGRARKAVVKPVMDRLNKDTNFQRKGFNAAQLARDPRLLLDLLKNNGRYKDLIDGPHGMTIQDIIGRMGSHLNPKFNLGKFGPGAGALNKPGILTNKAIIAQTDVMPGYMARILQQVTMFNTKKFVPLTKYDYTSNSFRDVGSIAFDLNKSIREYNEKSAYTSSAGNRAGEMLEELGLKAEDKQTLAAVLSMIARSKTAITGGRIKDFDGWDGASEQERRILEIINSKAGWDKDEKTSGTMYRVRTHADELRGLGDNMKGFIQNMIDQGHADELVAEGLIELDPDNPGGYRTVGGKLEKLQRSAIYRATSDVNAKGRVRKIDKNRALKGIRKTPVSSWQYKKNGRGHVGPMAQDVNRNLGNDAAPNGDEIDLVTMNGMTMAAIQKLSETQEKMIQHDGSLGLLRKIATGVGVGDKTALADPSLVLVDYARLAVDGISKTNYLLENKMMFGMPGFDFNAQATKDALGKAAENGKKFVDPLIRTGNKYIDGLQSVLFSAVQDGFEGTKWAYGKGKEGLKGAKKTLVDKPFGFIMDVLMRNEDQIKDRAEFLYKKSVEAAGKAIDFGTSLISEKIPAAIQGARNFVKNIKEMGKRIVNPPRDVYVKGDSEPSLTGARMRASCYVDESNKPIRGIDDLLTANGSITDIHTGGVVLKASDLADGVYDQDGNLLRSTTSLGFGLAAAGVQLAGNAAMKAYQWATSGPSFIDKGKEVFQRVKSGVKGFMNGQFGLPSLGTDPRLLRLTAQIRDLLAIGKPRKLVGHVYNRDLRKHSLEGHDFLALMYGDKFVQTFFGDSGPSSPAGGKPNGGNPNTPGAPSQGGGGSGAFFDKLKNAFGNYNHSQTFGQNMANAFSSFTGQTPGQVAQTGAALGNAAKGSKTFNFLKGLYNRGNDDDFVGPKRPGFFGRNFGRAKNFTGGLFGRMRDGASNRWNGIRDTFNGAAPQQSDWGIVDDHNALGYGRNNSDASDVEYRDISTRGAKRRGFFGRQLDRAKGFGGRMANRTIGKAGRLFRFAKGSGLLGTLGGLAKGIGGMFMGGSQGNELQTVQGGDLHQLGGPSNIAMIRDNTTGKPTVGDVDGDGVRDNGSSMILARQDEERRALKQIENDKVRESQERAVALMETRKYPEDDFLKKMLAGATGLFDLLGGGFKGVFRMLGGAGRMLGGVLKGGAKLARGAGRAAFGAIKGIGRGAGGAIARNGLRGAAIRGLGTVAAAGAATGSAAGTALGAVAFAARIALGPVGLALAGAQVAWWAGKKVYKYVTRNDTDDFGRVRMAQYGLGEEHKDKYSKFLALEAYLKEHVSWQGDSPFVNNRSIKNEEILEIFDIDKNDAAKAEALGDWFENRFKPFFYNALAACRWVDPKGSYLDVSKFTKEQLDKLCGRLDYAQGPYDVTVSPIEGVESLPNTYTEVKGLIEVLRSSAKTKPKNMVKDNAFENGTIAKLKKAQDATNSQNQEIADQKKKADEENKSAQAEKRKAEEERARLLGARNSRDEDAQRALMAVQAASEGRSLASNYRDESNRILNSGQSGVGVSDDGGKAPTVPQERSDGVLSVSGIPAAGGALADASKGLEGIVAGRGVNLDKMNPAVKQMFLAMAADYFQATGKKIRVSDGWRDTQEQARLYATMPKGRAARPGTSLHEFGAALDISSEDANQLEKLGLMRKYGFTRPVGGEPWHIEPAGIQGQLDKAKRDPSFLSEMMMASAGRGGGGIATLSNVRKYSRNDSYAMKIYGEGSSIKVDLPKPAANDPSAKGPVISGTNTPVSPTGGTSGESGPRTQNRLSGVNILGKGGQAANDSPIPEGSKTRGGDSSAGGGRGSVNPPNAINAGGGRGFVNPGAEGESPPSNVSGAKGGGAGGSIKDQIAVYAKEAGGDPAFMQLMAGIESSMGTRMTPHTGSAQGPFQFMPATWQEQMKKHGAKYKIDPGTSRMDLRASTILATKMFEESTARVKSIRGERYDIVDGYFTHMLGRGGAATFARLADGDIAANALPAAAKANPNVFYDKSGRALTAGEVRAKQMEKMKNVANTYGVDISPLIAGWDKQTGDKPGLQNDFNGGSGSSSGSPSVQAGSPSSDATAKVSTAAQNYQNEEFSENRRSVVTAANDERQREMTRPRIETDQRAVSGVRETSNGNANFQKTMIDLTTESRDHLSSISESLKTLISISGEKGTTGTTSGQNTPSLSASSVQRPEVVSSALDRTRKYG